MRHVRRLRNAATLETVRSLIRVFNHLPGVGKAYAAAQLAGPVGIVLLIVGAVQHEHALLLTGIVLLGLFFLDSALLFPLLRAWHDSKRRRSTDAS